MHRGSTWQAAACREGRPLQLSLRTLMPVGCCVANDSFQPVSVSTPAGDDRQQPLRSSRLPPQQLSPFGAK